jgi:hypothetical protein
MICGCRQQCCGGGSIQTAAYRQADAPAGARLSTLKVKQSTCTISRWHLCAPVLLCFTALLHLPVCTVYAPGHRSGPACVTYLPCSASANRSCSSTNHSSSNCATRPHSSSLRSAATSCRARCKWCVPHTCAAEIDQHMRRSQILFRVDQIPGRFWALVPDGIWYGCD